MTSSDVLNYFNIIVALLVAVFLLIAVNLLAIATLWIKVGRLNALIEAARIKRRKSPQTTTSSPEDLAPVSPGEDKYKRPVGVSPRYIPYGVMVTLRGKKVRPRLPELEE